MDSSSLGSAAASSTTLSDEQAKRKRTHTCTETQSGTENNKTYLTNLTYQPRHSSFESCWH